MTTLHKFCWVLWIGGTATIAASWADVVTPTIGWVGFTVALVGTVLSRVAHPQPRRARTGPPEEW